MNRSAMLALLAAVLVPLAGFASGAGAQVEHDFPTLSVTGQGEVSVAPDEVRVSFAVVTEAETVADAMRENSRLAAKVVDALKRRGIDKKDIQTTNFSIQPRYAPRNRADETPRIVGYRVHNQVRVRSDELEAAGELIEAGVGAGANSVSGIQFTVADEESVYERAVGAAAKDARRKAEALAEAAGVRLARIVSIDLQPAHIAPYRAAAPMMMERAAADAAPPIEPGEVATSASVRMVFEISEG